MDRWIFHSQNYCHCAMRPLGLHDCWRNELVRLLWNTKFLVETTKKLILFKNFSFWFTVASQRHTYINLAKIIGHLRLHSTLMTSPQPFDAWLHMALREWFDDCFSNELIHKVLRFWSLPSLYLEINHCFGFHWLIPRLSDVITGSAALVRCSGQNEASVELVQAKIVVSVLTNIILGSVNALYVPYQSTNHTKFLAIHLLFPLKA